MKPSGDRKQRDSLTSLIFPTYNPGSALTATWNALHQFLSSAWRNWEILFVCDGCTDGTPERLRDMAAGSGLPIRILNSPKNHGKGHAVRQGLLAAKGRYRLFADVDLAYSFADIERVASRLWDGASAAIASREHPESEVVFPHRLIGYLFRRHLQSAAFGALVRGMLHIPQRDTQAGLKGLSAEAVEQVVPRLRCDGFGFDCELLLACKRQQIEVEEVPVLVRYQDSATTTSLKTVLAHDRRRQPRSPSLEENHACSAAARCSD